MCYREFSGWTIKSLVEQVLHRKELALKTRERFSKSCVDEYLPAATTITTNRKMQGIRDQSPQQQLQQQNRM